MIRAGGANRAGGTNPAGGTTHMSDVTRDGAAHQVNQHSENAQRWHQFCQL